MTSPLPIKIYNTLTRKVEDFTPVQPGKVGMYLCGITPYGLSHVGNARTMIVFDTFRRFLKAAGYDVKFVRNFTDIDDKIIKRAQDENRSWQSVAQEFIQAFREDMAGLNVEAADEEPLVSDTLPEIVEIIDRLVKKDHAYINSANQDVVYAIDSFKNYGKLANRKLEEQQAGARVEVEPGKKNPFDFVLWKQAKPGEPSWPSPWGAGRPGWHIECSAMSCKHLEGDKRSFDIHGGGMDLQFPHHECEIAQSEGAYDHRYVNYWMHVAFINMAGEKMSKSIGNIMTVKEVLERFDGRAIRLNMLMTHYRQQLEFSEESVGQAAKGLRRIDGCVERLKNKFNITETLSEYLRHAHEFIKRSSTEGDWPPLVLGNLQNDFNTSIALEGVFRTISEVNIDALVTPGEAEKRFLYLLFSLDVLGLLPSQWPALFNENDLSSEVRTLLDEIDSARAEKNFTKSDALRLVLEKDYGGKVSITPEGAKWSKD